MTKIAVIGAGFFGYHISHELAQTLKGCEIDVFEKEGGPMLGAATSNQCRLHMGFHYPRSGYTIYQSIMGFDRFKAKYGRFVAPVEDNIYAVHRDGLCNPTEYLAVMNSFHLPYARIGISKDIFRRPQDLEVAIRVREEAINLKSIAAVLGNDFRGRIIAGCRIDGIAAERGLVQAGDREFGPYDFIVNATYTNPNLGLSDENRFAVKYEMAALVLCRTSWAPSAAVTIMDGGYVSVYPAYDGLHTMSSVLATPFRRYADVGKLEADYQSRYALAAADNVAAKVVEHVAEHLHVDCENPVLWVTAKTKLATDMGDSRVTEVKRNHRVLSVLCGKLDAVFEASDAIIRRVYE